MENKTGGTFWKVLGVQFLIVTAGVLVGLKIKEQMNKAKVSTPTKS